MYKVLYFDYAPQNVSDIIASEAPSNFELLTLKINTEEERNLLIREADFLLVATAKVTEDHFRTADRLKMIQHQGVGYDGTDVESARKRSIPIGLTPEGTSIGVAEHAILLILAVYKRLVQAHMSLQKGEWLQFGLRSVSYELYGKKLGLLGFGRIGRETALRADAFGASVIYHDPFATMPSPEDGMAYVPSAVAVGFPELLQQSDIISLHMPLTPETRGIMNAAAFERMKRSAIFINTARGGLVVEKDLIASLRNEIIAGAGLDVFEKEPVTQDNPLLSMDNVIATPHISAGTKDALIQKMRAAFANLKRFTEGEKPINLVM